MTGVYNPKAFVAHAASLGQACAHCQRSSTAASRRSLASVSVPVARVVLSHPLRIFALVGRYPANKLIRREPLPRWNYTFDREVLSGITYSFPWLFPTRGYVPRYYCPLRRSTHHILLLSGLARLACLIHAANVRSEPGSNPSSDLSPKPRGSG